VVNTARGMVGEAPLAPKGGARFHFEMPGSVQGFQIEESIESKGAATLENVVGNSTKGDRSLAIRCGRIAPGRVARAATPTFTPSKEVSDYFSKRGYALHASPTLYAGQTVRARVVADGKNPTPLTAAIYLNVYGEKDKLKLLRGPEIVLAPGGSQEIVWKLEINEDGPIAKVGIEVSSAKAADGIVYLDYLGWEGVPNITLKRPENSRNERWELTAEMWRKAWIDGVDEYNPRFPEAFRLVQNEGTGLLMQGTREWTDYEVSSDITPHMVKSAGVGARVQGMRRYYGLLLAPGGKAQLVKALDGNTVLAESRFGWEFGSTYSLKMQVAGNRIQGWVDGQHLFDVEDNDRPLTGGAIALICEEGRMASEAVTVRPIA